MPFNAAITDVAVAMTANSHFQPLSPKTTLPCLFFTLRWVIFRGRRVIFTLGRVIFSLRRLLFRGGRVIFRHRRVIFNLRRVVFSLRRVTFSLARVVFRERRVIFRRRWVGFTQAWVVFKEWWVPVWGASWGVTLPRSISTCRWKNVLAEKSASTDPPWGGPVCVPRFNNNQSKWPDSIPVFGLIIR